MDLSLLESLWWGSNANASTLLITCGKRGLIEYGRRYVEFCWVLGPMNVTPKLLGLYKEGECAGEVFIPVRARGEAR